MVLKSPVYWEYIEGLPLNKFIKEEGLTDSQRFNLCFSKENFIENWLDGVPRAEDIVSARVQNIRFLILDLAHGLKHLHTHNLIHRDVKPNNIMATYDENEGIRYVIIDNGLARDPNTRSGVPNMMSPREEEPYMGRLTPIGTQAFMAPEEHTTEEIFMANPGSLYSYGNDVWALATTVYYLTKEELPYREAFDNFFDNGLGEAKKEMPEFDRGIPFELKDLLCACFEPDPEKRITIDGILMHPFIQDPEGVMREYFVHLKNPDLALREEKGA